MTHEKKCTNCIVKVPIIKHLEIMHKKAIKAEKQGMLEDDKRTVKSLEIIIQRLEEHSEGKGEFSEIIARIKCCDKFPSCNIIFSTMLHNNPWARSVFYTRGINLCTSLDSMYVRELCGGIKQDIQISKFDLEKRRRLNKLFEL